MHCIPVDSLHHKQWLSFIKLSELISVDSDDRFGKITFESMRLPADFTPKSFFKHPRWHLLEIQLSTKTVSLFLDSGAGFQPDCTWGSFSITKIPPIMKTRKAHIHFG